MKSIRYAVILYVLFSVCSSFSTINLTGSNRFKPGYYFKSSEKIEGFINHANSNYQFEFKKSMDSKKVKITAEDCNGFLSMIKSLLF